MKKVIPVDAILIPDEGKCVFRGVIYEAYQWSQKMFDGSSETFEMLKRPDTVQIIAVKDNKLVIIKDQQPGRPAQIFPPRGRVDTSDSSWLAAAKRELKEETGMVFRTWRMIEVTQPAAKIEWFVATFLATDLTGQNEQELDAGERINVWLETIEQARELSLNGTYVSYLRPFFARISSMQELLALPEFKGREVDR